MNCELGSCYKTSDNKHFQCPPRMNDGRHFTDYRPNCHVENVVRENNQTLNSYQYRMFLTQNAEQLMDLNRQQACNMNCCGPCNNTNTVVTSEVSGETWGVGNDSCPQFATHTRSGNCCVPSQMANNYYPNSNLGNRVVVSRNTSPSGASPLTGGDPSYYS